MIFNALVPEIYVGNISASLNFYVDKLHFEVVFSRESEGFYFLRKEDSQIMLSQLKHDSLVNGVPKFPFGSGVNFAFKTASVEQFNYKDLEESIHQKIHELEFKTGALITKIKQVIFVDPDGYLLRFVQQIEQQPTS